MASATSLFATTILNGSFETGNFAPQADETMQLPVGATDITGWEVIGDTIAWIGPNDPWNLDASDGDYFLDLTNYQNGAPFGGVKQSIDTVVGTTYSVGFDIGSSSQWGATSKLSVSAAGQMQEFSASNDGTQIDLWESRTFSFTATDVSTELSFLGTDGFQYIGLDNVSIQASTAAIPLPSGFLLLLSGAGVMAFRRRSSRQ